MKNRYLPFGYKIADGKIVTDSEQVEAVRRIFDAYTAGQTFQQIADVLSAQGISTENLHFLMAESSATKREQTASPKSSRNRLKSFG